jgi:ketosteroid isomerase-like protein
MSAVLSAIQETPGAPAGHQDVLHASAIAADDRKALEPYFTEDVELRIHGFAPMDGSWNGRADLIAAATRNYQMLVEQQPRIETMVDQRDRVFWLIVESGYLKETGQRYRARGVQRVEEFIHTTWPA